MFCLLSDFRFDGNFNTNVSKTISCDRLTPTVNSRAFNPGRDLNSGVFKTHTHTHTNTQCLSFKKPIFTYPAAAIATICKEQHYFPDVKFWKIFWSLEWDKKRKRLLNTWPCSFAHGNTLFSLISLFLFLSLLSDHSFVPLCSFQPLYVLYLTNQEVYVFITLYTAPVSTAPLYNRYISVFAVGKPPKSLIVVYLLDKRILSQQIQ